MWKEKVSPAYLLLENEPIITHRFSFVSVRDGMVGQVIRYDLLSSTPDFLPSQSDRWYPILLRSFEEIIQPGEEAQQGEAIGYEELKHTLSRTEPEIGCAKLKSLNGLLTFAFSRWKYKFRDTTVRILASP